MIVFLGCLVLSPEFSVGMSDHIFAGKIVAQVVTTLAIRLLSVTRGQGGPGGAGGARAITDRIK